MISSKKVINSGIFIVIFFAGIDLLARMYFIYGNAEVRVNNYFLERNILLTGSRFEWNILSPVAHIEKLTIGDSSLHKVVIQLDFLQSILEQRIVLSGLVVESAEISLEMLSERWKLVGLPAGGDSFDIRDLWSIDTLDVNGLLHLQRDELEATLTVHMISNLQAQMQKRRITFGSEQNCNLCNVAVAVDSNVQPIFDFWTKESTVATIEASNFLVAGENAEFLGIRDSIIEVYGVWKNDVEIATSRLAFAIKPKNGSAYQSFNGEIEILGGNSSFKGIVRDMEYETVFGIYTFPEINFAWDVNKSLNVWLESLNLDNSSDLISNFLEPDHQIKKWIDGLQPRGVIDNVRVKFNEFGTAFSGDLTGLKVNSYKGVPRASIRKVYLSSHNRSVSLSLTGGPAEIAFPELFEDVWSYEAVTGTILFALLRDGYFGVHGADLSLAVGNTKTKGEFALAYPRDSAERRLSISLDTFNFNLKELENYVPNQVPGNIRNWLGSSVRSGRIESGTFRYHGYNKPPDQKSQIVFAIEALVESTILDYHPEWPLAYGVDGRIRVDSQSSVAEFDNLSIHGIKFSSAFVTTDNNANYAKVSFEGKPKLEQLFNLIQDTPIRDYVGSVPADWEVRGLANLTGSIGIPLSNTSFLADDISLEFRISDATIELANYGIKFEELTGPLDFRSELGFASGGIRGKLFGEPVNMEIASSKGIDNERNGDVVIFSLEGVVGSKDIYEFLNVDQDNFIDGNLSYEANLFVPKRAPIFLELTSDLIGLEISLPKPLEKTVREKLEVEVNLDFLGDYTVISMDVGGDTGGWLHLVNDRVVRGSIGVQADPLIISDADDHVTVTGKVGNLILSAGSSFSFFPSFELKEFVIDNLLFDRFAMTNVNLSGIVKPEGSRFTVRSRELEGELIRGENNVWNIGLDRLRVESSVTKWTDMAGLTDETKPEDLIPVNVEIDKLTLLNEVGSYEDYGSYRFKLRPEGAALKIEDFTALIKGITVTAQDPIIWDGITNTTFFKGEISGQDLADVLPLWGYEVNMDSASFTSTAEVTWQGSPLDFAFGKLQGEAVTLINNGRFLDVDQGGGAVRLIGLFNYSAIFQRMQLNFSDLLGKGLSFNRVYARTLHNGGKLQFIDPMIVEGNSSLIRLTGRVDLNTGSLDNEMIVTLPLDNSLPWYAAYIALANPAAGVGVLLARRIFDDQIESISSGRYSVRGTLDDPIVEFDTVFTTDTTEFRGSEAGN